MLFTCNFAMSSTPFLPLGQVQIYRMESPEIIARGSITNPYGPLKLGGYTNISGSRSYLLIEGKADGVHLNEPTTDRVIFDTPLSTTQPFQAVSITSTGSGTFGGDLAIGGSTTLQTVAVAGAAAFASSVSVAGRVSANSVTVSGMTVLQGDTVVGGGLAVAGAVLFQHALTCGPLFAASANVQGDSVVEGLSTTQKLSVTGDATLGSLSVIGNSALNTLSTVSSATFGAGVSVTADLAIGGGVTVNGAAGITVPTGTLTLGGAQLKGTADTLTASVNGATALAVDASTNLTLPSGSLTTKAVYGNNSQALVLKGADAAGTVHIAGNLVVDGDYETADRVTMQVEDTRLVLAHSQTGPQPDSVADGAGIEIEGSSGYAKSITWNNKSGLDYKGDAGTATEDGLSYFEVQGGNLVLTRTIPAANHLSRSSATASWQPDSMQTVVSYAFRIDDQENLQIAKTQGTDYSNPATGGGYQAVGQAAKVCTTFKVAVKP